MSEINRERFKYRYAVAILAGFLFLAASLFIPCFPHGGFYSRCFSFPRENCGGLCIITKGEIFYTVSYDCARRVISTTSGIVEPLGCGEMMLRCPTATGRCSLRIKTYWWGLRIVAHEDFCGAVRYCSEMDEIGFRRWF